MSRTCAVTSARATEQAKSTVGRLAHWELVELAAEGNLYHVYYARSANSENSQVSYVVKLLRPEFQNDKRALAAISKEALAGRTISSPHVVPILDAGLNRPPYYLVVPRLYGQTLKALLAECSRLPVPRAIWIVRQTAEALAAFERANWVHGDVRPSNIFVSPEGHVTLIDATFAHPVDESVSVVDRCVISTVGYFAPETLTSTLRADIRSDIFSLGVVLYEMLTGRRPYPAQNLEELLRYYRQTTPLPVESFRTDVPMPVIRLLNSMLAKDPLRRPQSAQDLVEVLVEAEIACLRFWSK